MLAHQPLGFVAVHQDQGAVESDQPEVGHGLDAEQSPAPLFVRVLSLGAIAIGPADPSIHFLAAHPQPLAVAAKHGGDVHAGGDDDGCAQAVVVPYLFRPVSSGSK